MEPRRERQHEALNVSAEPKPKRFRIVKLEERIAPRKAGNTRQCPTGGVTCFDTCNCLTALCPTEAVC
jgi:hypothetical protein